MLLSLMIVNMAINRRSKYGECVQKTKSVVEVPGAIEQIVFDVTRTEHHQP